MNKSFPIRLHPPTGGSFLVLLLFLVLSGPARATELTDLGHGLAYLGVQSLAGAEKALRSAVPGTGALVLDLRQVKANDDSPDALRAALGGRAAGAPLFVLVGPATPPAIAEVLAKSTALTLGIAGSQPAPKVVVKTDADSDRRAGEALAAGTPVETLISGKIEKDHFDEATLVHEFKNGNPDAAPPAAPDPTAEKSADAAAKAPKLVDRVLQRAVQLHHALLALRS